MKPFALCAVLALSLAACDAQAQCARTRAAFGVDAYGQPLAAPSCGVGGCAQPAQFSAQQSYSQSYQSQQLQQDLAYQQQLAFQRQLALQRQQEAYARSLQLQQQPVPVYQQPLLAPAPVYGYGGVSVRVGGGVRVVTPGAAVVVGRGFFRPRIVVRGF